MKKAFIFLAFAISINLCKAQNKQELSKFNKQSQQPAFIENKGQIHDQNYKANPAVKYLLILGNGLNVQLKSNSFSYDTYKTEVKERKKDSLQALMHPKEQIEQDVTFYFHRVDVELLGAKENPTIIAEEPSADYLNYYNAVTPEEGATYVRSYKKVTYKNIYNGIDLEFVAQASKAKPVEYNFIVHPGADAKQIQIKYNGANGTKLAEEKINIEVAHGTFSESIPASWLQESKQKLNITYKSIATNTYGFNIPNYNPTQTLIIDPNPYLEWGTYYGGDLKEFGYSIVMDSLSNVYFAGYTNSLNAIATSGAYQSTYGGGMYYSDGDAFLAKFNESGIRQWATYYGGELRETFNMIALDSLNNIVAVGETESETGISSSGAFQTIKSEWSDVLLVKFNNDGMRQWATYLGGLDFDYGNGVCCDGVGNIYITGSTSSSTNIISVGAYQYTLGGGSQGDAFIAKFNSSGNRIWSTYYGGNDTDIGYDIKYSSLGYIYLVGYSMSTTNIASVGAYKTLPISTDAFIAKFNTAGIRQWGTYYGGNDQDFANGVTIDRYGNVIIVGHTFSTNGIATTGVHQTTIGGPTGDIDGFITKFNSNGNRIWGTYYGGNMDDKIYKVTSDTSGNIYVAGETRSPNSSLTTYNAHQSVLNGIMDAFLVKFNNNGVRQWATFYGGSSYEQAMDLAVDLNEDVYLTGCTNSINSIATIGVHQIAIGSTTFDDAFLAKFSKCEVLPANGGTISGLTTVCQGQTSVRYVASPIANATSYIWATSTGMSGNSITDTIIINFSNNIVVGTIMVKGKNACGTSDSYGTLSISINRLPSAATSITGTLHVCPKQDSILYTTNVIPYATSYIWGLPNGSIDTINTNNIYVNYDSSAISGSIQVRGLNFCGVGNFSTAPITVHAIPNTPIISVISNFLQSDILTGNQWYNQNGLIIGAINATYTPTENGNYYVIATNGFCKSDTSNIITITDVGVLETYEKRNYKIYPNPAHSELNIEIPSSIENSSYEIYNVYGQSLYRGMLQNKTKISIANLPKGIYLLKFEDGGMVKFVKE